MTRALADVLSTWVANQPQRKLQLDTLMRYLTTADPTLLGDPAGRAQLAAALTDLATAGRIVVPKTRAGWDDRTQPALPRWFTKSAEPPPTRMNPPERVWPQQLEEAASIATRPDERELLDRIMNWLRDNPSPEPVPMEERSLDILDDEKALVGETAKRLFISGALTLDLLACYPTPVLFPSQHVAGIGETGLLVAENNASFHSLLTVARELDPATRPDLHIGWGSGNQFPASVTAVELLAPPPTALYYIGDLDVAGMWTAVNAAATAAACGFPPLRPATVLYRWLIVNGTPRPDRSNTGRGDPTPLLAWLPTDLHEPVAGLFARRQRIPQESLGLRALRADPTLLPRAVA